MQVPCDFADHAPLIVSHERPDRIASSFMHKRQAIVRRHAWCSSPAIGHCHRVWTHAVLCAPCGFSAVVVLPSLV